MLTRYESDAIVTLAGGLDSSGNLSPRTESRVETGVILFEDRLAPYLVFSGDGWVRPTVEGSKTEPELMKDYAVAEGVPEDFILTEENSRETIGNAVFTKRQILRPNKWRRVALVTSHPHLVRASRVFRHVLGPDYSVRPVVAPETTTLRDRIYEVGAKLALDYIFQGTEPGDDEAILQRLRERVPGYGNDVTFNGLALRSLVNFVDTH